MTAVLHSWVHNDQQPRRENSGGFSIEIEHKVVKRIASRFLEIAKLLLENRLLSRKESTSCLEASGQQSRQDYRKNGSDVRSRDVHPFEHQRKKDFMNRCTNV